MKCNNCNLKDIPRITRGNDFILLIELKENVLVGHEQVQENVIDGELVINTSNIKVTNALGQEMAASSYYTASVNTTDKTVSLTFNETLPVGAYGVEIKGTIDGADFRWFAPPKKCFYIVESTEDAYVPPERIMTYHVTANTGLGVNADLSGFVTNLELSNALAGKQDTVNGKGLSTNDFDNSYKGKLDDVDNTPTADSQKLVKSGGVKSAIEDATQSVGYAVCSTAAATAAKTVSLSGYTLRTGGSLHILMNNANTASNVTLKIGDAVAKNLFYNGSQASASNTWKAGEVIEVYYDGTQYQATNAQGGGASLIEELNEMRESYPLIKTYDTNDAYSNNDNTNYYYDLSGTSVPDNPTSGGNGTTKYSCIKIAVKEGQHATIYTKGTSSSAKAYGITNTNNVILSTAADVENPTSDRTENNPFEVDIEQDGYLYVNISGSSTFVLKLKVIIKESLLSKIEKANSKIDDITDEIEDIKETYPQVKTYDKDNIYTKNSYSQYYWSFSSLSVGDTAPSSRTKDTSSTESSRYASIDPIEVKEGQDITVYTKGGQGARAYAVTDKAKTIKVLAGSNANTTTTPFTHHATEDGYLYVNCQWGSRNSLKVIITDSMTYRLNIIKEQLEVINVQKINNLPFNPQKQNLRILHIGNSFSIDATAYLSGFVEAATPAINVGDLCIYRLAMSSGSFKTWVQKFNNNDNTGALIKNVAGSITCTFNGIKQALCNYTWDLIVIQQVSTYSGEYDAWEGSTSGGYLKEFIRILKTYQPSASIAFMMVHATHPDRSGKDTSERWREIADGCKFMKVNYGVDLIIPVGTAIENIRLTQDGNPLTRDNDHLGYGLARYVANACYFQSVIAARYGVSVFGNSYTRDTSTTEPDASGDITHQDAIISVDSSNKELAQKAALLACSDMFTTQNPSEISI